MSKNSGQIWKAFRLPDLSENIDEKNRQLANNIYEEKVCDAEKNIAIARLMVVFLNAVTYLFLSKELHIPWLAWTIILIAFIYSSIILLLKPYKRYSVFRTSYYTSVLDAILISFFLIATGYFASPYYPLWYISIIAIAYRFTLPFTLLVAFFYSILYLGIIIQEIDLAWHWDLAAIRIGYIFLIGLLAGYLSEDTTEQVKARIQSVLSERKAVNDEKKLYKARDQLQKAHDKLEERVEERTTELKKVNEELKRFAYIVSHDLKAPLRGLYSLSSWLISDEKNLSEEGKENLVLIKEKVERMNDLINGVLQFSRIGRKKGELKYVNLNDLLNGIIADLDPPENITINKKDSLPEIYTFPVPVRQVLMNLIQNAIKYMDKENGKVEISAEKENSYWKFAVKDNGPGIDPKYHKKIFEMFQRLQKEGDGTGMGLSLSKKIVEGEGGKIWLDSEPGKGAAFYFTIPEKS